MSFESLQGFYQGFGTDISMTSYLIVPCFILWWISLFFNKYKKYILFLSLFINSIILFLLILIELSSIPLFDSWGTTFNARAYHAMVSSDDARMTALSSLSFSSILPLILIFAVGFWILRRIHLNTFKLRIKSIWIKIALLPLISFIIIVVARGGLQKVPLTPSDAFYTHNQSNNYLAVNKTYYFAYSLKMKYNLPIDKIEFDTKKLKSYQKDIRNKNNIAHTDSILSTTQPNIVLILLEGCPADVIEPLGGIEGLMPNFSKFCEKGILFDNIYSSGFRTDQGVLSVMSGIPALPYLNILKDMELISNFPSLFSSFYDHGYQTSFTYGGNLNFSNFNNYFLHHNTDRIVGKSSFSSDKRTIDWGVPDDFLLQRANEELNQLKPPFFAGILTQGTHPPFDMNGPYKYGDDDVPSKFKSTVAALDKSLGVFMENCKKQQWYDNTLFVILSDHGSLYLGDRDFNDHRRFQIPLLFFGPAINDQYKSTTRHKIGNHHDIAHTLLSLLNMESKKFIFSRNLFADTENSDAFWITEHTLGWITAEQKLVVNHRTKEIYSSSNKDINNDSLADKAMMHYKLAADYILKQKVYLEE